MTADDLSEVVGISRPTIAKLENGQRLHVTVDELVAFAAAFSVPVESLLDGTAVSLEKRRRADALREEADRLDREAAQECGGS
jgi:transcriptional regulator with XRE-family HTH domain